MFVLPNCSGGIVPSRGRDAPWIASHSIVRFLALPQQSHRRYELAFNKMREMIASHHDAKNIRRAAIGVRMHSGWGALVAVSNRADALEVIERRRIAVTTSGSPGGNQPYHFVENLELQKAEEFLANYLAISKRLAVSAVRSVVHDLERSGYRIAGCAVLLGSGRPLPPLIKILSSHALIHAAEGEFFRALFSEACEDLRLPVTGIPECHLNEHIQVKFGEAADQMLRRVETLGRSIGPPWTKDQQTAALAAASVLAKKQDHLAPQNCYT